MHDSVIKFIQENIGPEIRNGRVIELGSYNVNGTARQHVLTCEPELYLGVDIRPCDHGAGCGCVDLVMPAEKIDVVLGREDFDVVICTEMLEHSLNWKKVLVNANYLLRDHGKLILTTRSPGFPYHEYPGDYWRFTLEDMKHIFKSSIVRLEQDRQDPGVFVVAVKVDPHQLECTIKSMDVQPVERPTGQG